jgi:hypothetical protein
VISCLIDVPASGMPNVRDVPALFGALGERLNADGFTGHVIAAVPAGTPSLNADGLFVH